MARYICGPSLLRFPGRPVIVPGEIFEHTFEDPAHERIALVSGAITPVEPPPAADAPAVADTPTLAESVSPAPALPAAATASEGQVDEGSTKRARASRRTTAKE